MVRESIIELLFLKNTNIHIKYTNKKGNPEYMYYSAMRGELRGGK